MKIILNSKEVTAINPYVNAVAKSIAKATNLLNMVTGGSKSTPVEKEITLKDWEQAASEARASGIVEEANLHADGSYSIEIKSEFIIGTLNITRRVFDKYMDLGITMAVMIKQMVSGFTAEIVNICEDELGDFKKKVEAEKSELRAREVESAVSLIIEAAQSGASNVDLGHAIIDGFTISRSRWVSTAQAQSLVTALESLDIAVSADREKQDPEAADNLSYIVCQWKEKAAS